MTLAARTLTAWTGFRRHGLLPALGTLVGLYAGALEGSLPRRATLEALRATTPVSTAFMDRARRESDGTGSARPHGDPVRFTEVSPSFLCALVKAEDPRFFRHGGIDVRETLAVLARWTGGEPLSGASTLTQQLARNLFLAPERTLHRKLREAVLSRHLDAALPKERIVELYLGVVEWGAGTWGLPQAARAYAGKEPRDLDVLEATVLVSILPAPRLPLQGENLQRVRREIRRVLFQLLASGYLTRADYDGAKSRADTFDQALRKRDDLALALRGSQPPGTNGPLLLRGTKGAPLTHEALVASSCGLDAELAFEGEP